LHVAADGGAGGVAWAQANSLVVQRSVDGGTNWLPTSALVATATGFFSPRAAALLLRGSTAIVAWEEYQPWHAGFHQYYGPGGVSRSTDEGATWSPLPAVLDPTSSVGSGVVVPNLVAWPATAPLDSCAAIWGNQTQGALGPEFDRVRATLLFGHQPYGAGSAGSGLVVPTLTALRAPLLGQSTNVRIADARGGSLALLGATFAGPASVPLGSGLVLVQAPVTAFWGVTSGPAGSAGAGTFALPLAIPAAPVFATQRLNFQGFVLDPAANDGFSRTAGMELWTL
jgi:hypothetical protein